MAGLNRATRPVAVGALLTAAFLAVVLSGCSSQRARVHIPEDGLIPGGSIPPIDTSAPAHTETATFALGCFWCPDSLFGSMDGVVRTRVGYAGGTLENPTYRNLGDHTETIQIDYDPTQVSYGQLLEVYWGSHNPTRQLWSRQYMSIVFYHNSEQLTLATQRMQREEERLGRPIHTEIVPFSRFYLAEDYHQKYHLQQIPELMEELTAVYPDFADFRDSTAVARINGYVRGHTTLEELQERLNSSWPASG